MQITVNRLGHQNQGRAFHPTNLAKGDKQLNFEYVMSREGFRRAGLIKATSVQEAIAKVAMLDPREIERIVEAR